MTSSNIVGYQTVDSPAASKYKALTVSFEDVANGKTVKIADLIKVASVKSGATCIATVDQIWLWDSANDAWTKYFFCKSKGVEIGWAKEGEKVETTDTITNGETFFFRRATGEAATTLTLSGAVKEFAGETSYTVSASKYKFMGYPWPVALPIAGFQKYQSAVKSGATCIATVDQIWRWDSENDTWLKYFFCKSKGVEIGWAKEGAKEETTDVIPAGEGFFFRRATGEADATITFTYEEKKAE